MLPTVESVQQYADKKGLPISEVWLLLYDAYADRGLWTASDKCYTNYLDAVMPK